MMSNSIQISPKVYQYLNYLESQVSQLHTSFTQASINVDSFLDELKLIETIYLEFKSHFSSNDQVDLSKHFSHLERQFESVRLSSDSALKRKNIENGAVVADIGTIKFDDYKNAYSMLTLDDVLTYVRKYLKSSIKKYKIKDKLKRIPKQIKSYTQSNYDKYRKGILSEAQYKSKIRSSVKKYIKNKYGATV